MRFVPPPFSTVSAVSRRSDDEIHPWPPNGDLRPVAVLPGWTANVRFWAPIAWADEVTSRARHEGSQSRQEVKWLEQELGGAIAKGAFELVDNEAVAVGAQAIDRQRGSGDGATQPLELLSLIGPTGHEFMKSDPSKAPET